MNTPDPGAGVDRTRGRYGSSTCHLCGKFVAYRDAARYKARVRHKCPHGVWCLSGEGFIGRSVNWAALYLGRPPVFVRGCEECYRDQCRRLAHDRNQHKEARP